MQQIQVKYKEY